MCAARCTVQSAVYYNVCGRAYGAVYAYDYDNVYADGYGFRELNSIFEFEI